MCCPDKSADSRAFKLRVRAESQPELNHAEVDLWFSLGPDYPAGESSLALFVEGVKGMSDGWVKELDAKLRVAPLLPCHTCAVRDPVLTSARNARC
eukprot:2461072-Rhodomonas_salina.2